MATTPRTAILGAALTLAAVIASVSSSANAQQIQIDASRPARQIIGDTNNYRASRGSAPLAVSAPLMQAAQAYAEYQARTNTTGHTADSRTVEQRILATGAYKPCIYAENVFEYWQQPDVPNPVTVAGAAMNFWKNSPGHEANLRDARTKHIGVGVAAWNHGGRNYYKVVQVFGDDCGATKPTPVAAGTCKSGYVWRVARPSDLVCVTPASRRRIAIENRLAASRIQPGGGAYGPNTCLSGYVWREAFNGDLVCVTPEIRALVRQENQLTASRVL